MVKEKKPKKAAFSAKVKNLPSSPPPPQEGAPGKIRRTDEEIKKDRIDAVTKILEAKPDPVLIPIIKMFFNTWPNSQIAKIPYEDLRKQAERTLPMSDKEASELALPLTQLKNYYLPNINPIWFAWTNLISCGYSIIAIRMQMMKELREFMEARYKIEHPKEIIVKDVCRCLKPVDDISSPGVCMICKKKIDKTIKK